jgi:hypothetical protein
VKFFETLRPPCGFLTLQRPASLLLPSPPNAIFSAPDGSCFLVLRTKASLPCLTAYHWQSFGSTQGINLDVPDFSLEGAVLTSIVSRGCIFLIGLDTNTGFARSMSINITKKVTEFIFKKKGSRNTPSSGERRTLHNSLLDCHNEVWTRFPVLPAVKRRTVTSSSERQQKSLTFITEDHMRPFGSYLISFRRSKIRRESLQVKNCAVSKSPQHNSSLSRMTRSCIQNGICRVTGSGNGLLTSCASSRFISQFVARTGSFLWRMVFSPRIWNDVSLAQRSTGLWTNCPSAGTSQYFSHIWRQRYFPPGIAAVFDPVTER